MFANQASCENGSWSCGTGPSGQQHKLLHFAPHPHIPYNSAVIWQIRTPGCASAPAVWPPRTCAASTTSSLALYIRAFLHLRRRCRAPSTQHGVRIERPEGSFGVRTGAATLQPSSSRPVLCARSPRCVLTCPPSCPFAYARGEERSAGTHTHDVWSTAAKAW